MSTTWQIAVVTGGAGFIGSHMVDHLLDRGYRVRVIDNLVGGRVANLAHHEAQSGSVVSRKPTSAISARQARCLLASTMCSISPASATSCHRSNGRSNTWRPTCRAPCVCSNARARPACEKFVYAASSSCYGLAAVPTREDHPIAPQYPYALSKYQGEQAAFHWHRVYRLPVNSIRIFNAYGTRLRTSGAYGAVFGVFFKQKLAGKPFTVVGDGTQKRDFLYASDVAAAFLLAAETRQSPARSGIWAPAIRNPSTGWSS